MAESYDRVSKWFHWITVPLMLLALSVGFVIQHIKEQDKLVFYAIHESTGLTLFLVALARFAWRLSHPAPPLPRFVPAPLRVAAWTVHGLLYLALMVQPVLGFIATNAFGFPLRGKTALYGFINLPVVMEKNPPLAEAVLSVHVAIGWSILALLVLHIGGVVFHQAIRRDGLLLRMV